MTDERYEFSFNPIYVKQLKKLTYLIYAILFINTFVFLINSYLSQTDEGNVFLVLFFVLSVILMRYILSSNIKLIIDKNGISTNNFFHNKTFKQYFKWSDFTSIVALPVYGKPKVPLFFVISAEKFLDEIVYIPIRKAIFPVPMGFSDKAWTNPNITLKEAIEKCSGYTCINITTEQYITQYSSFGSRKELGKPVEIMTYSSVIIIFLGFALLFFDDLFTLNFGFIKLFLLLFFLVVALFMLAILATFNKRKEQNEENTIGIIIVSLFFGLSTTVFSYASFNLAHQHLAQIQPISFTLVKENYRGKEYDKWQSDFGTIDCQLSDVPENSEFTLNVYDFMTVKRFEMGEICLADERRANKE